jgi:release factor glutamine methyltransferase
MATIKNVSALFKQSLKDIYDANEVESLTLLSLTEITGTSKAILKAFPEREITEAQSAQLTVILNRLKTGEPIQYILGYTEFYGLIFKVNPSVLIPRPETEELVEWVLSEVKIQNSKFKILDIGTGSGCIAISLKKNLPGAKVSAIDISADALHTARENAELNNVEINFIEADILNIKSDPDNYRDENPKFEIIISNPPYVTQQDKTRMHTNVTDFEPHTALFVPEDDPLLFYKAIAQFALENLSTNGLLFFEISENFGAETIELLKAKGFKNMELRKDMSGRDRMVKARINNTY